jgi:hypothetical protein
MAEEQTLRLSSEVAASLARVALGHVTREYPHKLDHVMNDASEVRSPRALHPIFYGSFDWHSCVHSYWLLAHTFRMFPDLAESSRIRDLIDSHFTDENVHAELAYLEGPSRASFERPYGWAWLLKLAAELSRHQSEEGQRWFRTIRPLAEAFAQRFVDYLPKVTYPIRAGTHGNSAFALALAADYAEAVRDSALSECVKTAACLFYLRDEDCQGWEPSGEDFLSPALVEVECMRRILSGDAFVAWLNAFLPRLSAEQPRALFEPAHVSDRNDGKICHLDGLNLSRAWCWRALARAMGEDDARSALARNAAHVHLKASLPHLLGDYAREHWLATYALLALGDDR